MEKEIRPNLTVTAEDKARKENCEKTLDTIIGLTFARHAKLTDEEYLKELKIESTDKTEEEIIRIAKFNALQKATSLMIQLTDKLTLTIATLKLLLSEEKENNGN